MIGNKMGNDKLTPSAEGRKSGVISDRLLSDLGVSEEAEALYFEMLHNREVVEDHELLDELINAGLVEETGRSLQLVPASVVLRRQADAFLLKAKGLAELASGSERIERRSSGGVEVTHVIDRIVYMFKLVFTSATKELRGFDKPPHINRLHGQAPGQEQALNEGVLNRFIYEPAVLEDDFLHSVLVSSIKQGEQARIGVHLPFRMIIADDKMALIMTEGTAGAIEAIFITEPEIVRVCSIAFETFWTSSIPFIEGWGSGQPSEELMRVLKLLSVGLTDEAIARKLDISTRTVTRRVNQLSTMLGATSRFQLGVQAYRAQDG